MVTILILRQTTSLINLTSAILERLSSRQVEQVDNAKNIDESGFAT